jgi:hypothetical protein
MDPSVLAPLRGHPSLRRIVLPGDPSEISTVLPAVQVDVIVWE